MREIMKDLTIYSNANKARTERVTNAAEFAAALFVDSFARAYSRVRARARIMQDAALAVTVAAVRMIILVTNVS